IGLPPHWPVPNHQGGDPLRLRIGLPRIDPIPQSTARLPPRPSRLGPTPRTAQPATLAYYCRWGRGVGCRRGTRFKDRPPAPAVLGKVARLQRPSLAGSGGCESPCNSRHLPPYQPIQPSTPPGSTPTTTTTTAHSSPHGLIGLRQ